MNENEFKVLHEANTNRKNETRRFMTFTYVLSLLSFVGVLILIAKEFFID